MFKSKNKIQFIPTTKGIEPFVSPPKPAKNYLPSWYKQIPGFNQKKIVFGPKGSLLNTSVKMCMPFLDSLTTGYIFETWTDIHIKIIDDKVQFHYATGPEIMKVRDNKSIIPVDDSYHPVEFVWQEQWDVKTPKGWSVIYTHPLNFFDSPFTTCTAVIDSDNYYHTRVGQYPFFIKKDFEGIIPAGTPMYQIIPFKRSDWESEVLEYKDYETDKRAHFMNKSFFGVYKNNFWVKKKYE